jgi:hypothetical protein
VPQPLELSKKRSRSVRIVKRDSRSIRTVSTRPFYLFIYFFISLSAAICLAFSKSYSSSIFSDFCDVAH